jgi:hypothetical protein
MPVACHFFDGVRLVDFQSFLKKDNLESWITEYLFIDITGYNDQVVIQRR